MNFEQKTEKKWMGHSIINCLSALTTVYDYWLAPLQHYTCTIYIIQNSEPNKESRNSWMHITPQKKHATHATHLQVLSAARGTGNRFTI